MEARFVASKVEEDKLVHVFGNGWRSIMGAMEVFWRVGGFANVNAIFPAGLSLIDNHPDIKRTTGIAYSILRYSGVGKDDVLILINVNGISPITIDSAMEVKKLGAKIIATTSPAFANNVPPNISTSLPGNKNF